MALEREKIGIGVTTGAKTAERYRADLPDIGANIQTMVNTLAAGEREVEERRLRDEATEAVRTAISSAVISQDKEGNYVLPTPPEKWGPYAKQMFNEGVKQNYQNHVTQSIQEEMNTIRANYQYDPELMRQKLDEANARNTGRIHVTMRGNLTPTLIKERNDRVLASEYAREKLRQDMENEDIARKRAGTIPPNIGPGGEYIETPPPADLTLQQRELFVKLHRSNYENTVQSQLHASLVKIAQDNELDPVKARQLMQAEIEGRLKGVDPRFRNQLIPIATNALESLHGQLVRRNQERDNALEQKKGEDNLVDMKQTQHSLRLAGDPDSLAQAEVLEGRIQEQRLRLQAIKKMPLNPEGDSREDLSRKAVSDVVRTVTDKLTKGELNDDHLEGLINLTGNFGIKEGSVAGYDKKWLDENLPDLNERAKLNAALRQLQTERGKGHTAAQYAVQYKDFLLGFEGGRIGEPTNVSEQDRISFMRRWLVDPKNVDGTDKVGPIDPKTGQPTPWKPLDMRSPDGLMALRAKFGFVPNEIIKTAMGGVRNLPHTAVEERYQKVWLPLNSGPDPSGKKGDLTAAISPADDAFMTTYDQVRSSQSVPDPATAAAIATKKVENPAAMKGTNQDFLLSQMREATKNPEFKLSDLHTKFDNAMFEYTKIGSNPSMDKMPLEARNALYANAANRLVYDINDPDAAIQYAARAFKATWTQNPNYLYNGWIRTNHAPPAIQGPDNKTGTEYMDRYADALFKSGKVYVAGSPGEMPADAKLGTNVFLQALPNGTAMMVYRPHPSAEPKQLMNADNNLYAIIDPIAASKTQKQSIEVSRRAYDEYVRDRTQRQIAISQGAPIGPEVGKKPPPAMDYGPFKPEDILIQQPVPSSRLPPIQIEKSLVPGTGRTRDPLKVPTDDEPLRAPLVGGAARKTSVDSHPTIKSVINAAYEVFPEIRITDTVRYGETTSQHGHQQEGRAMDVDVSDLNDQQRHELIRRLVADPRVGGLGWYNERHPNILHVDTRQGPKTAWGPDKHRATLYQTPYWFRSVVEPWTRGESGRRV